MAQNQQIKGKNILETNMDLDPVGVIYNIQNDMVEEFVTNYLKNVEGIDGVLTTRSDAIREGNYNPELKVYLFLHPKSKDVITGMGNIDARLLSKIEQSGIRASEKFNNVLKALTNDRRIMNDRSNNVLYIELDVFRILALMLNARRNTHNLNITDVKRLKKSNWVATVVKSNKFVSGSDVADDKYANIIRRIHKGN